MMDFLFYLFITISIIDVTHFGLYLAGANYYDIAEFRRLARKTKLSRTKRPTVTVLIPAHNEELGIIRCLDSVRTNSHRNLEIIVIDDASTDTTTKLVRAYIAKHSHRDIRLIAKRKNVGKAEALNHALRKGVKGEFVMTLDADSVLHKQAIKNAVRYFETPNVVGVAANVRVMDSTSLLGLLQKFEYMVGYRSKKFFSVTNSEFIVGGVASTYRYSTMKAVGFYGHDTFTEDIELSLRVISQGNKTNRIVYGADVLAMTEGVQSFKALLKQRYRWKMGSLQSLTKHRGLLMNIDNRYSRMLTFYRIPMAFIGELIVLLEPLVIGYVVYLSFLLLSTTMLIGSYATITLYLLWNLAPDEHMSVRSKLKMAAYTPIMYFLFYTMNVVQLSAIVRCLFNPKQILRKTATKATWISPARQGQKQVSF